jgi:hypothetical protein
MDYLMDNLKWVTQMHVMLLESFCLPLCQPSKPSVIAIQATVQPAETGGGLVASLLWLLLLLKSTA